MSSFANKIGRLPVVDKDKEGDKLVGIISEKNIQHAIEKNKKVKTIGYVTLVASSYFTTRTVQ